MGLSKTNLSKRGYSADAADTACECRTSEQTMQHCNTCWDAHPLKTNAAWKIWWLLMRIKKMCKSLAKHMTQFTDDGHEKRRPTYHSPRESSHADLVNWKWHDILICFSPFRHQDQKQDVIRVLVRQNMDAKKKLEDKQREVSWIKVAGISMKLNPN